MCSPNQRNSILVSMIDHSQLMFLEIGYFVGCDFIVARHA
ncbi:unnamed protein product [Acidithrix sp. C25]|nr:unnamed protein product [Acidithrix sp. C25]